MRQRLLPGSRLSACQAPSSQLVWAPRSKSRETGHSPPKSAVATTGGLQAWQLLRQGWGGPAEHPNSLPVPLTPPPSSVPSLILRLEGKRRKAGCPRGSLHRGGQGHLHFIPASPCQSLHLGTSHHPASQAARTSINPCGSPKSPETFVPPCTD